MPRRSELVTYALIAAAAATGGWLLLVDRGAPSTGEQAARAGLLLRVWRQEDVTRIGIARGSERIELVRDGDDWKMTAPRLGTASILDVNQLLNALGGARAERSVGKASAADRATFGLDAPRVALEVAMKGVTLKVSLGASVTGESSPDGGGSPSHYVEVAPYGDFPGGVFVVAGDVARALDRGAEAYRDPSLLAGNVSLSFARVSVHGSAGGGVTLVRAEHATWRIEGGVAGAPVRADTDAVDGLFHAFAALEADPFLPDDTAVDVAHGGTIDVERKDGGKLAIAFGGACGSDAGPRGTIVQMRAPEAATGCVPTAAIERLLWPAADYVDGHPFALLFGPESGKLSEIEAVRIERAGKPILDAERRGDGLHLRVPADEQIDKEASQRFFSRLVALHGALVPAPQLAALGLAPPAGAIVLRRRVDPITLGSPDAGAEPWDQRVEVGAPVDDPGASPPRKVVHVRRVDDGAVLTLSADAAQALGPGAALDLRSPNLLDVGADQLDHVATTSAAPGAVAYAIDRPPSGAWQLVAPPGLGADASAIVELTRALAGATCARWASDADGPARFGFEHPSATIALRRHFPVGSDAGAPTELTLDVGAPTTDGVFVRVRGRDAVCVLPEGKLAVLLRAPVDRTVVGFDPTDAARLVVTRGASRRAVQFDGKAWHDDPDAGAPLGDVGARTLADAMVGLRALDLAHLGGALADEGLATPTLTVTALDGAATRKKVTIGGLGKLRGAVVYFARVDGIDATYGILRDDVDKVLAAL